MTARLVILAGPLEGQVLELTNGETTVGRHSTSDILLSTRSVSRRHCVLECGDDLCVRDLGSQSGTFVNDQPVTKRSLVSGDMLRVADSIFRVVFGDQDEKADPTLWIDDDLGTRATRVQPLSSNDMVASDRLIESSERSRAALAALLRVAIEGPEARDLETIGSAILPLALEAIPAERIVLVPSHEAEGAIYGFRGEERIGHISRTVCRSATQEGTGLLWNRGCDPQGLERAPSLLTGDVWSVLAVPLPPIEGRIDAVLYLDSRRAEVTFDEGDLHQAAAFAALLAPLLSNLRYQAWLDGERLRLQAGQLEHDLVGQSPAMGRALALIARVAITDSTVLVHGESGTGKELAARAVHRSSARVSRPFVPINCAALSENLLESELFGHERGAFTGADRRKSGKIETADSGTLFLDEIGELPLALQARLLRFLQEREFERVGGTRPLKVDVRVVAATNRDLATEVKKGRFREDLFHRLNVISIELPPLRERAGDIPLLAAHFASEHCRRLKRPAMRLSRTAQTLMERYRWPGNVRELANAVERAVVLGDGEVIRAEYLPESLLEAGGDEKVGRYHDVLLQTKKKLILSAVRETGGRYTDAARILGLNANYLHRLIRNLGIKGEVESTRN